MVNTEDFIKRLENLLDYYSLSASSFADKIGVQRSSLSHLLSGRNKPSLDFVMKIAEEFPEVDLYWILNGKEPMLKNTSSLPEANANRIFTDDFEKKEMTTADKITSATTLPDAEIPNPALIEKIIIFYKDGTFDHYSPKA